MTYPLHVPLLEVTRGDVVESLHFGSIAVVDATGRLVASVGDADLFMYPRSSAKPFQTLPLVEMGGVEHFGLTERELALTCASHSGTDDHVQVAASIQKKIGVTENQLLCGAHYPYYEPRAREMMRTGEVPTPNRNNCSGKHSGMLAQCQLRGLPTEDYINPQHPVQQTIFRTFAEMCDYPVEKLAIGMDGCSAPVFAAPLRNVALAYARLCDPIGLTDGRAAACRKIVRAMTQHPDMVAGPERFDTLVMQRGAGRIVAKAGAEGYQGIGLMPGALGPGSPALGIAFKIADGDQGQRARTIVAIELLRQIGAIGEEDVAAMDFLAARPVRNWRKFAVGQHRPVFELRLNL